jgi:hypothetical protein
MQVLAFIASVDLIKYLEMPGKYRAPQLVYIYKLQLVTKESILSSTECNCKSL